MIATRITCLLAVVLMTTACALAPTSGTMNPQSEEQARLEMLSALEASADSWNRGDLKGHLRIYDESVTVMTKTGPRPTIAAIETSFGNTYFVAGKAKQSLGFDAVQTRMLTPDSALMTGRFKLSGGGLPDQSGWFSLVWLRTALGWRVVHDHTS